MRHLSFFQFGNTILCYTDVMTLANVYYSWGIMIIFTIIRYFQIKYECGNLRIEECDETE